MLYNFLSDHFTPERLEVILESIELLARFNLLDLESQLEEIAFHKTEMEVSSRISEIVELVTDNLLLVLNLHSITLVNSDISIKAVYDITHTLKLVSEEYDAGYILEAVDMELTETNEPIDVMSNLVGLVTETPIDDVLEFIYDIEPDIINNIRNLLTAKMIPDTQFDDVSEQISRYKKYLNGRRVGLVHDMVIANIEIGKMDFNVLFGLVESSIDEMSRKDQIFELISLALISSTPSSEINSLLEKISRLMGETEAAGKLYLSELMQEYKSTAGD